MLFFLVSGNMTIEM